VFLFAPDAADDESRAVTRLQVRVDALAVALDRAMLDAQLLQNQRALCAGGLFLALTHELSNGIHAILSQLSVLKDAVGEHHMAFTPVEREGLVAAATARTRGLMQTFDDLLATVKPKTGVTTTNLAAVLTQVYESTRSVAGQLHVHLFFPAITNPRVRDARVPVLLQQALLNLVLNAAQHTGTYRLANALQNGLVEVKAELERDEDGEWLAVRIRDNGPGIDGEAVPRVFDMYHTTRKRGSGLGLYVTRGIVESTQGTVEVERSIKFIETVILVRIPIN
jgi:signal transduction histidine kinase